MQAGGRPISPLAMDGDELVGPAVGASVGDVVAEQMQVGVSLAPPPTNAAVKTPWLQLLAQR